MGELFLDATVSAHEMFSLGYFQRWDMESVQTYLNNISKVVLSTSDAGVFVMRTRLGFFGHNAPKWKSLPFSTKVVNTVVTNPPPPGPTTTISFGNEVYPRDWDGLSTANPSTKIWEDSQGNDLASSTGFDVLLERSEPKVVKGSWVVLQSPGKELLPLRIGLAADVSRADYAISAKCTGLQLNNVDGSSIANKDEEFKNRTTTAFVESESLTVIGAPISTRLHRGDVEFPLDRVDKDLRQGQVLALKGENADLPGTIQREMVVIALINHSNVTTLTLRKGLEHSYVRSTVTLNANVVPATHGESTREVLGSGDAARPFQSFVLKEKLLTYVSSANSPQPGIVTGNLG